MASGAVGTLARHDLRRRWPSLVAIGLVGGLLLGTGLAALAGARRTDTVFARHQAAAGASDVEIDPGDLTPEIDAAIRALPGVRSASYWVTVGAFLLDEQGGFDPDWVSATVFTSDGRYLEQDRVAVHAGRLLDPSDPDEVMLNRYFADALGVEVGSTLRLGFSPIAEGGAPPAADRPTGTREVRVVGIMALPEEAVGSELDEVPKLFVSPALEPPGGYDANPDHLGYAWYGLVLDDGEAGAERVVRSWEAAAARHNAGLDPDDPGRWISFVHRASDLRRTADRALSPTVAALATFGLLGFVGGLVLLAQALARLVRQELADVRVGQVLGLVHAQATRVALAAPAMATGVAVLVAAGTAVALSPRFPTGPYRVLEPSPGVHVDPATLTVGLLVVVLVALGSSAWVAHRQTGLDPLGRVATTLRASSLVRSAARAGVRPVPVAALRLTLEPGEGRERLPVRVVLASSVITVALLVATTVFGANLAAVTADPERIGWRGDAVVLVGAGYLAVDGERFAEALDAHEGLAGWRLVGADRTVVDGRVTPGAQFGPWGGVGDGLVPVVVEGRAPNRAGEVALGRRTMRELGVGVGDRVELGSGEARRRATVTGAAVFPELGPVLALRTRLDDGVWTHPDDVAVYEALTADPTSPWNVALLDLTAEPGAAAEAARSRLADALDQRMLTAEERGYGATAYLYGVVVPPEVRTAAAASRTQTVLVGVIAAVALASLLFTLHAVVRRRRRDLAILASLGFTPRQLRTTIFGHGLLVVAAGVLLGTPLGVAAGRMLWYRFAGILGIVPDPSVPWPTLAALGAGLLLAAAVISSIPAVAAGRAPFEQER